MYMVKVAIVVVMVVGTVVPMERSEALDNVVGTVVPMERSEALVGWQGGCFHG